jgi:hypothetical protein
VNLVATNWLRYLLFGLFAGLVGVGVGQFGEEVLGLVVVVGILLWVVPFPGRLVVLLCAGFLIGGRVFAFLMWSNSGLGLPLFVTETVVAVTMALLLLGYLVRPSTTILQKNATSVRKPVLVFWTVGSTVLLISVWHCVEGSSQLVPTLRNAALFYYSIFYLFVLAILDDIRLSLRVTHWFSAIIVMMSIRFVVQWNGLLLDLPQMDTNFFCVVAPIAACILYCALPVLRNRWASVFLVVLISTAVVLTDVRQGLLGLICGGLCSYWLLRRFGLMSGTQRKTVLIFVALFVGTLLMLAMRGSHDAHIPIWDHMIARDFSDTGRRVVWAAFLDDMLQSWTSVVFGVGFDRLFVPNWMFISQTLEIMTNRTTGALQLDPHNSHLHLFYRLGLIGFSAYLLLIRRAFLASFRYLRDGHDTRLKYYTIGYLAALTSVAGQAFVGVLFEAPHRGIPFWVLLGVSTCFPRIALAHENDSTRKARAT